MAKSEIVERIKDLRTRRMNLSQSEFCDRYGLLLETYKKWEQGARALDAVVVLYLEMILIDPEGMAGMVQKVNWRRQLKAA